VGPRAARVHFGGGHTGFSTGAGSVGFYTSLGGGRSAEGLRGGSSSAASYQRQLVAQQRPSALAEKAEQARVLANEFLRIINLHRVQFVPASAPVVPASVQPDRAAIYKHYEQGALAGLSVFNRRGRKEARQRASVWAEGEVQRQWVEASRNQAQAQAYFDERWRQLCDNVPDVVIETLEEAFEDNEVPSAAVGVDGGEVALVVLVPDVDMAVPERMPTTTQAGNLSLKKLTQRDREDYYKLYVCGQVLVTVREAFAVAPGLRSARVAVLRSGGYDADRQPTISCILAAKLDRAAFDEVQWETADAAQVLNDASTDLIHNPRGRSRGLSPIDLAGEAELAQLIEAVDLDELTASDPGEAGHTLGPPGQGPAGGGPVTQFHGEPGPVATPHAGQTNAAIPPYGDPSAIQRQSGPANPSTRPGWLKRPVPMAILLGIGIPVVLCCGIGAVIAAIGGNENKVPARSTTSSVTTAPAPGTSAPASTSPTATSSTITTATTAPVLAPPVPPPATTAPPPAPPPPPPPPATQTGVHPGAFCSPHWAFGFTSTGVLMQCKPSATDSAFRWRKA
jgi:hypothetical protein